MENFTALQAKRSTFLRQAEAIVDRALREGRPLRPGEELDVEGLEAKVQACDRTLRRANDFDFFDGGDGMLTLTRAIKALHTGSIEAARAFAARNYAHDPSVTRALQATTFVKGGAAVPTPLVESVIEALRPRVAVRRLGAITLPMSNGNLTWPRISVGGTVAYGSENASIAATDQGFQAVRLTAKKATGLTVISGSLVRTATPAFDEAVKQDLLASLSSIEDTNFIRGDGAQDRPRGLRYLVPAANLLASGGTADVSHIDADLAALEAALTNANVPMLRPGWILSTRTANFLQTLRHPSSGVRCYPEMDSSILRGKPFVATTSVPVNLGTGAQTEIYLADFSEVVIGDYSPIIDVGSQATYQDANNNVVAAFSLDQVVLRCIVATDIGVRHSAAVAVSTGVSY